MAREFTEVQAIRNLQRYLRQLAFFDPSLPEVPIDGIYASETREAVEIFQRNRGFAVTGEADRETWDAIYAAYRLSDRQYAKPIAVDVFYREPDPAYIQKGDVGFHIAAVQYMLQEILPFYGDTAEIPTDGIYGDQTADAVQRFQMYADLPQSGEVDVETWNRLAMFYNEYFRHSNQ